MRESFSCFLALGLCVTSAAHSDNAVDVIHYACHTEQERLEVWFEQLTDDAQVHFFDKPYEGAYDPNELVDWNREFYRASKASTRSPIVKACKFGASEVRVEIHFAGVCQDGALASVAVYSKDRKLYESRRFGTSCTSGDSVGSELVQKITVTPGQIDIQSGLWFW